MADAASGFDVVERKGVGHPESLADLIAEEFSQSYSLHGLDRFGFVPNHWVDKIALVGAESVIRFGRYTIRKPVSAYLFGKVTRSVGGVEIAVSDLFRGAVQNVLRLATGSEALLTHLVTRVENTAGTGADHSDAFYRPQRPAALPVAGSCPRANDTAFCSAYAPADPLDLLAIDLENHINSTAFAEEVPMIGSDVKVMLVRSQTSLDVTVCLPVHPEQASTRAAYDHILRGAYRHLQPFLDRHRLVGRHSWRPRLALNTKDGDKGAYLAPFGTSLGKGDCGLVGRGNRGNGVISARRGAGVEALAGKNPLHHSGKIYTLLAMRIADQIFAHLGAANETTLVSRNGDRLDEPSFVGVRLGRRSGCEERRRIADIVRSCMSDPGAVAKRLLNAHPLDRFRNPALVLEA